MFFKFCASNKIHISNKDDNLSRKAILKQVFISIAANLSVLSPGMGLGYPAIVSQVMINTGILTAEQVSWFASVTSIACPVGGLLAAIMVDKIGRKATIIACDIISIIQWIIIVFASHDDNQLLFIQLMIARTLTGISIGMCATPSVVYLSEICHPQIRGSLLVLSPFMLAVGTLLIYIIESFIPDDFYLVSLYALAITVIATIVCLFIPETPVYLVTKNKLNKARNALSTLRNIYKYDIRVDDEIREIQQVCDASKSSDGKSHFLLEFKKPELYKPLLIMLIFIVIQQFSGIYVIFIFAAQFSHEAGVVIDEFVSTIIIGIIRCVATLLVGYISDIIGRKSVAILSSTGIFASMIGLALCTMFSLSETSFYWVPTLLLFFFCFIGTLGVLTLPFSMIGEVFPQKTRGLGVGISLSFAFFLSFFTIKTFATVFEVFGGRIIFTFHAIVALLGILFSVFILPETKGKTLQEIENYFRK